MYMYMYMYTVYIVIYNIYIYISGWWYTYPSEKIMAFVSWDYSSQDMEK